MKNHQQVPESCGTVGEGFDPRVRRTRQLLEDAFRALIEQKSLDELLVQDITDYATINRATFYAHYNDKYDLAASVLRRDLKKAVMQRVGEDAPFTADNMIEVAVSVFEFLENLHRGCPQTASQLSGMVGNMLQSELHSLIEHWLAANNTHTRLFPNVSKATVASVISWSIYGGALSWSRSQHHESAKHTCQEIVSLLIPSR